MIDYVARDCARLLGRARERREALKAFTVIDIRDAEHKARLHDEAESAIASVKMLGDLIIGAALVTAGSNADTSLEHLDAKLEELALRVDEAWAEPLAKAAEPDTMALRQHAVPLLSDHGRREARRPFHWLAEFPEVFLRGADASTSGFDAILGNPPFSRGQNITGPFGEDYRHHLVNQLAGGRRGIANLCVFFVLRASALVRPDGVLGLLADKTIAEGDSRVVGLEAMCGDGFRIFAAWHKFPWPGSASVAASQVHVHRPSIGGQTWAGQFALEGNLVPFHFGVLDW